MDTLKKYALSSFITFVATFLTILGGSLMSVGHADPNTYTVSLFSGLVVAAVRGAVKALTESVPAFGRIAKK